MARQVWCSAITMTLAIASFTLVSGVAFAQRYCCEGDSWLKWNRGHREAYVTGYILGYYRGYARACEQGTKTWPRPITPGFDPAGRCLEKKHDFSKGTDFFLTEITNFYQRYPENRNLLVDEILEELGKGNMIESIHEHPPFPRHN